MAAETLDPRDAGGAARRWQAARSDGCRDGRIGGAARFDAEENLGLGVGDLGGRGEEFEMRRLDRGDHGHMRPHQARQRRDLAGMVHAELENRVARLARQAGERQRHTPMIVEDLPSRGMARTCRAQRQFQHFLGAGLADAAGDPTIWAPERARAAAARRRGPQRIVGDDQRRIGGHVGRARACTMRGGAASRRTRRRHSRGRHGWVRSARRTDRPASGCGCRSKRPMRPGGAAAAARVAASASARVQSGIAFTTTSRTARRASSASSKGSVRSLKICPVS